MDMPLACKDLMFAKKMREQRFWHKLWKPARSLEAVISWVLFSRIFLLNYDRVLPTDPNTTPKKYVDFVLNGKRNFNLNMLGSLF